MIVNKNAPQDIKDKWRRGAMMDVLAHRGVRDGRQARTGSTAPKSSRGVVTRYQDLYVGLGMHTRLENSELPGNVFKGQLNECNARGVLSALEGPAAGSDLGRCSGPQRHAALKGAR
ncbi:MAG: hypothetical protein LKM38_28475 [Pseudomonas veronii]|nr:hypothetical protein [Pseudomonas veronii]